MCEKTQVSSLFVGRARIVLPLAEWTAMQVSDGEARTVLRLKGMSQADLSCNVECQHVLDPLNSAAGRPHPANYGTTGARLATATQLTDDERKREWNALYDKVAAECGITKAQAVTCERKLAMAQAEYGAKHGTTLVAAGHIQLT